MGLSLRAVEGSLPEILPTAAWLSQAAGTVRHTGMERLGRGRYEARYTLTDSGAKVGYAPNGNTPDTWRVVRA
jgi:hypothetical protein